MILLNRVTKTWKVRDGEVVAVNDLSLTVPAGSFFTLLGPSGCGKTTTLRIIAGLEIPDSGEVTIGDTVVFSDTKRIMLSPHTRKLGMVFQSYAIWPHLSVEANVMFPLKKLGLSRTETEHRTKMILAKVGMLGLAKKPATRLSGGEQQRVALARALVASPQVLLLDEPLSNLDAKLREEMRKELKDIQRDIGVTTLYVTHDQQEALTMSDYIAVMSEGRLIEVGKPEEMYYGPNAGFTARFLGKVSLVPRLHGDAIDGSAAGQYVRPEDVTVRKVGEPVRDELEVVLGEGVIVRSMFFGERKELRVAVGAVKEEVVVYVSGRSELSVEDRVRLVVPRECLIRIGEETSEVSDPNPERKVSPHRAL